MRWTLLVLVGCGSSSSPAAPDAVVADGSLETETAAECHDMTLPPDGFKTSAPFGAAEPGTLAGWDPSGRWFLTGVQVTDTSSFRFDRTATGVNVDLLAGGTLDDTELFWRGAEDVSGVQRLVTKRVSNRHADGTLRAQRAVCDDATCIVCTAVLVRATHNANEGEGSAITLLGQLNDPTWGPGYTFNVRVVGTVAYLIRQDGLHIIETADPAHPVELGHYKRNGSGYSNDVKLVQAGAKRYAVIADYPVDIVDVTDPAAPTLAANIPEEAHTVAVETRDGKTLAYFGNYNGKCPVYDVTNPLAPAKLGSFSVAGAQLVHDLSVVDGIAYLNAWNAGFVVVDFTTPSAPVQLGKWGPTPTRTSHSNWTMTAGGKHFALHGEEAYGAHLSLVDLGTMQPFGEWKTRDWVSIHNLMAFGNKAYFSYYQDGIRVLDMSNPSAPKQVGYYNTWDPQADYTTSFFFEGAVGLDVDLSRKLIFVADSPRGLLILKDETP